MGAFYDNVLKMRKNGKSVVKTEKPVKTEAAPEIKKTTETVVKKNDKGTGRKS
jgi:hypothetical protein